jgi:hypothetical protein
MRISIGGEGHCTIHAVNPTVPDSESIVYCSIANGLVLQVGAVDNEPNDGTFFPPQARVSDLEDELEVFRPGTR